MPKVVNMHHIDGDNMPGNTAYVGRGTKFGNPFKIGEDGDRHEVVQKFERMLNARPLLMAAAKQELKGKDLACWCAPRMCHADILLRVANS